MKNMVKIVLRIKDRHEIFEVKEMNEGMAALLQLITLLTAISEDTVIAFMDEANWQKIEGEK